ncbi:MAG: aminotransferase class III-fold pyridoxal phosphate-dependent enzyme [Clostridia bacterium]|nr:aminotransferase class III-fold pyridoxal phosphate-dependent enzyme [Clostridia bacterium]
MDLKELDSKYIAGTYKRFPITAVSGKGSVIVDDTGKEYIDMGSGIGVTSFGISDDTWKQAVIDQLSLIQHTSNLYYTRPCIELAQMLCEKTGMKKVFFSNSGAEANECAIKAARKYASVKYGNDRCVIATLHNSFHGRTLTTLAATGQDHYHELFTPLTAGFVSFDAGDMSVPEELCKAGTLAAVMIECIQGEGGVIPLDPEFVHALSEFCAANDVLLIVDEVQTGNGRTGKLYAYMNYGITPDIVSTAKGLGGGLPLGATLLGGKCENVFAFGDHGSTFGGNPVVCAAAISVLSRIDDALLADVRKKSAFIFDSLSGASGVESVSGMGLMIGIKTKKAASEVVAGCIEKGVLCLTAKDKVRLLPALNIDDELLKKAIDIIKEVCEN